MSGIKLIAGIDPGDLPDLASRSVKKNRKLLDRLKRHTPANLDELIHEQHEVQFNKIDCLDCANCCKTTPALLVQRDIDRISRHLGLTPGQFLSKYVEMDEDGDFVFNTSPCPLLGDDNYCSVYEVRPASCADYPHTMRRRQAQILELTLRNTSVCPAVYRILEELRAEFDRDHSQ